MKKYGTLIFLFIVFTLVFSGCKVTREKEESKETEVVVETEMSGEDVSEEVQDYTYEVKDNAVTLTKYTGDDENVYIPAKIEGLPVTEIGESCFAGNISMKKVHVPEGVTKISDYAFECCSKLEKAYLPESLLSIEKGAFSGCGQLYLVDIQEQVEEIGDGAFLACGKLISLKAPKSLKKIGEFSFALCTDLYTVDLTECTIKEIPARAFYRDNSLARIPFPDSLETIGKRAFTDCTALKYPYLPPNVNLIREYAFEGCSEMISMNIPSGEVEGNAFNGCYAMNGIGFGTEDIHLCKDAFLNTNIKEEDTYLPENVTYDEGAFMVFEDEPEDIYMEESDTEYVEEEYAEEEVGEEEYVEEEYVEEEPSEEPVVVDNKPDWDNIKTIEEIYKEAEEAGYKLVTNDEFSAWSDAYCDFNKDHALLEKEDNVFVTMYKAQQGYYYKAMNASATKHPLDMEYAYKDHGDDFVPMYEVANHGLRTEMDRFKMTDDLLLFTGVYDSQVMFAAGTDSEPTMEELKNCIGSTFTDPSLTSTTTDVEVAESFSKTMFIIYAPKESMDKVGEVCMDAYLHTGENEVLFYSGCTYEILDVGYFPFEEANNLTGEMETNYEKFILLQLLN